MRSEDFGQHHGARDEPAQSFLLEVVVSTAATEVALAKPVDPVDELPPWRTLVQLGLQHVLAMSC